MPVNQPIRAADFAEVIRRRLADDTEACRLVAYELAVQGEALAVRYTNDAGLVDEGFFKRAWFHNRLRDGAEFGNDAPYAPVLERGRRPMRPGPPIEPIREWVIRKLVGNGEVEPEDAEDVAQAIRWSLHVKGMKGRFVLLQTTNALEKRVKPAMVRVLRRRARQ